jgi:hypothetical protein
MNEKYSDIYNKLLEDYLNIGFRSWKIDFSYTIYLEREIESMLDELSRIKKIESLRSDAVFFLISNIVNMVLMPLLLNDNGSSKFDLDKFRSAFKNDVNYILEIARADSDGVISGHSLINALSESWPNLKMMSLEIWG